MTSDDHPASSAASKAAPLAPTASESGAPRSPGAAGRSWLRLLIALAITAVVIAILIDKLAGTSDFVHAAASARPAWIGISVGIAFVGVAIGIVRWQLIVHATGYRLPYWRGFGAYMASLPFSVVTPSRANDLLRPVAVRDLMPVMIGTGTVLAERAIDLFVLLVLASVGSAFLGMWWWAAGTAGFAVAEVVTVVLLMRHRGWIARIPILRKRASKLDDLFLTFDVLRKAPLRLGSVAFSSLLVRFTTIGVIQALLVATHSEVSLLDTFGTWPIAMTAGMVPLTLAGMGTRDAAFIFLLHLSGTRINDADVLAATIGYSLVVFWLLALLGIPFMVREITKRRHGGAAQKPPPARAGG